MNLILFIILLLHFLNDGIRTAIISILPFVVKDLNFNYALVGILGASQGLLGTFLAFPSGFISSKIGGFKIIIFSLLLYSLGGIGIGMSAHPFIFILFFYITASGFGMFHTVGYTLIARLSNKSSVGKNLGNFTAIGDVGRIVIPFLGIAIASSFLQWRSSYILLALIGIVIYLFVQMNARIKTSFLESHSNLANNETPKEWLRQAFVLLRQKNLALITTSAVLDGLAGNPMYIFLPFLLLVKGVTAIQLGLFVPLYFFGSFAGKAILGRGVDKFGAKLMFIFAEIAMSASILALIFTSHLFFIAGISFALGLFTRGTTPVLTTLFFSFTHDKHYEKIAATSEFFTGISAAAAPVILGVLADQFGIFFVFYSCSLLAFLAIIPTIFLKRSILES